MGFVVTYDTHRENYMETQEGKDLPVSHCIKDTDGWKASTGVVFLFWVWYN